MTLHLPTLDPTLALVSPLASALKIDRAEALALIRSARDKLALAAEGEETIVLGTLPLERAERIARILRRVSRLHHRLGPAGVELRVDPETLRVRGRVLDRLAKLLEIDPATLREIVRKRVDEVVVLPDRSERILAWRDALVVVEEAGFDLVARVSERAFELPGMRIQERFKRRYPQEQTAVHLIGYLRGPTYREAKRDRAAGLVLEARREELLLGDWTELAPATRLRSEAYGRTGLERRYDATLRGRPGVRVEVRDVRGGVRRILKHVRPQVGRDLNLTVDVDLQKAVERALDRAVVAHGDARAGGAAIVMSLKDGDLLCVANSPRFDPNTLGKNYTKVAKDPRSPQRNRAMQALPPASTWKVLSAFAAFDPTSPTQIPLGWTTVCTGSLYTKGPTRFGCDGVHGRIGLSRALQVSCNVFFFRAADLIGLDALVRWADKLGLGKPVSLDLGGEHAGLIPRAGYKEARFQRQLRSVRAWEGLLARAQARTPLDPKEVARAEGRLKHARVWRERFDQDQEIRPGEIRNTIIGQGDVLATPLQVACVAALVANGGEMPRPRILRSTPSETVSVPLEPSVLDRVREGMRRVVTRGTASGREIGLRSLDAAGKTGTAERSKGRPHVAWFMGYYPTDAPEIAFAVVVDRTRGHGGGVTGPVAAVAIKEYERLKRARTASAEEGK